MRALLVAMVLGTVPATSVVVTEPEPGPDPLVEVVTAHLPVPDGATGVEVNILREDPAGWAFGTAVALAPEQADAYPDGWLWLARTGAGGAWRVALEGTPGFTTLSQQAPVLAPAEQEVLATLDGTAEAASASDYRTGMRLPYAVGQSWRYTGGPHPMGGNPRSSIDLAGGDGRVLAARDGVAYSMCGSGRGWLRVVHDRGFATDYYHLENNISGNGRAVREGDFLGNMGSDVSCGGYVTGPHLHFSLRRHGSYVAIDRYSFGKWSILAGAGSYQGYARHGSHRVNVGGSLRNHGALGFTEGIVDTNGGGVLNRRTGPGTGHDLAGTVADGATVTVRCSARGTSHTGRGGYTSNLWNQLDDGSWVSDVFLWTGTGDPVGGRC